MQSVVRSSFLDHASLAALSRTCAAYHELAVRMLKICRVCALYFRYRKRKRVAWLNFCLRYAGHMHSFPGRLVTNASICPREYFYKGAAWTVDLPTCECGKAVSHAMYSAYGTKMVKSTPYLEFICKTCRNREYSYEEAYHTFEEAYHPPSYLCVDEYNKIWNHWGVLFCTLFRMGCKKKNV